MIRPGSAEGSLDILYLVDQLERLVRDGFTVPLLGRVMVDRERLLEVVDQIRLSVPEEILRAQDLLGDREELLASAQEDAQRLLSQAQERVKVQLQDSELVRVSEARAQDILVAAREQSAQMLAAAQQRAQKERQEAESYVVEVLRQLEAQILVHLSTVRGGIKVLEEDPPVEASDSAH